MYICLEKLNLDWYSPIIRKGEVKITPPNVVQSGNTFQYPFLRVFCPFFSYISLL